MRLGRNTAGLLLALMLTSTNLTPVYAHQPVNQTALDGVYKFTLRSKTKAAIQVVVGTLETYGEVLSPATCPEWVKPSDEVEILPAYAEGLVGMKKEAAASCAEKLGWQYQIGQEDDQMFSLTRDYRLDRITVSIKKGLVTQSLVG